VHLLPRSGLERFRAPLGRKWRKRLYALTDSAPFKRADANFSSSTFLIEIVGVALFTGA
jgi:hypothetical protein